MAPTDKPSRLARAVVLLIALLWSAFFLYFAFDSLRPHSVLQSNPAAWPAAPMSERIFGFFVNPGFATPGLILVVCTCRRLWIYLRPVT